MKYDVFGIGNALVDKEFEVTEDFLAAQGIQKGMMTLIDEATQQQLLAGLSATFGLKKRASGGSAANSIVAVSQFGGKTFYACKVANDETGEFYMHDLHAAGVTTKLDQVRGSAEDRQVEGARFALQHNAGLGGATVVTLYGPAN